METKKKFDIKNVFKLLLRFFIAIAILAVLAFSGRLLWRWAVGIDWVSGQSMEPNFHEGDKVYELKHFSIHQGDVVVIKSSTAGGLIKRVIATEGQIVDIDFEKGIVCVDGKELNEQVYEKGAELNADYFINELTYRNDKAFESYPVTVPEGHVFVLGDNRNHSLDSRNPKLGMVPVEEVFSKVFYRKGEDGSSEWIK